MMSSRQLQKLLTSLPENPENLEYVLEYAESAADRFIGHHVQLLAEFCLSSISGLQANSNSFERILRLFRDVSPRISTVRLRCASELDLGCAPVVAVLRSLSPCLRVDFSAPQLNFLVSQGLFDLIETSSLTALEDVDAFCERLPVISRLRCYFQLQSPEARLSALNAGLDLPNPSPEALEALADALGDEGPPSDSLDDQPQVNILEYINIDKIANCLERSNFSKFGLAIALNYLAAFSGASDPCILSGAAETAAREALANLLLSRYDVASDAAELEIYASAFALLNRQEELLHLFFSTAAAGRPFFSLYERIIFNIEQIEAEEPLQRFVETACAIFALDGAGKSLCRAIAGGLMDQLSEPNSVLPRLYDRVLFCLEGYCEMYCREDCDDEDRELLENYESWFEYINSWLVTPAQPEGPEAK